MANIDLMNVDIRRAVIKDIKGEENKKRRAESLKRFEVYRERQERYILEKLNSEFSETTVKEMRKILSINLCPRIVDKLAGIYKSSPEREVANLNENQTEQLKALYSVNEVDVKLNQANKYYKLQNQCAVQVVPRDGKIKIRVLMPHQYDVVPDENDPEKAYAYIISVFDKYEFLTSSATSTDLSAAPRAGFLKSAEFLDGQNEKIADSEDYKAKLERYEVWTADNNFIMDGTGATVSDAADLANPIGELPFIDVTKEKDFEFWQRRGNGIVDFAIDFGAQLSDIANIIRMQGYAQAIIYADKQPENMVVGPNQIMFLQTDPNRPESKPSFEFANPGSDLQSSLDFLEMTLRLFLTSKGIDPKTVSGKLDAQSFNSGIERLLAMIDSFESSKDDIELFRQVELKMFDLLIKWSNLYQGSDILSNELKLAKLPDDAAITIMFKEPQAVQTKAEKEDSVIKLLDKGLITKKDAIMQIQEVDSDKADEIMQELADEKAINMTVINEIAQLNETAKTQMVDANAAAKGQ